MVNTKKKPEKNKAPIKEETLRALNRLSEILLEIARDNNTVVLDESDDVIKQAPEKQKSTKTSNKKGR